MAGIREHHGEPQVDSRCWATPPKRGRRGTQAEGRPSGHEGSGPTKTYVGSNGTAVVRARGRHRPAFFNGRRSCQHIRPHSGRPLQLGMVVVRGRGQPGPRHLRLLTESKAGEARQGQSTYDSRRSRKLPRPDRDGPLTIAAGVVSVRGLTGTVHLRLQVEP